MRQALHAQRIVLPKSALYPIGHPLGWRIECEAGTAWVTHDHHPRDIMLTAGTGHTCEHPGRVLVQALDDIVIRVQPPAQRPQPPGLLASIARVFTGRQAVC